MLGWVPWTVSQMEIFQDCWNILVLPVRCHSRHTTNSEVVNCWKGPLCYHEIYCELEMGQFQWWHCFTTSDLCFKLCVGFPCCHCKFIWRLHCWKWWPVILTVTGCEGSEAAWWVWGGDARESEQYEDNGAEAVVESSACTWHSASSRSISLYICRPGRCREIPEILKIVLKFTPCPEIFANVLKFLNTPVNGASVFL